MSPDESNPLPRLFLIRHGDTEWTDLRKHTGLTDIPLTARGEDRARQLGSRLAGETFTRVFTSPLVRAKRTCDLAGYADRAETSAELVEWDYGVYEGRTTDQIQSARPDWQLFRDGVPAGESPAQVADRADRFIRSIQPLEGDVAAFSSGHIIRMIAARWLGFSPQQARCFYTATASVGILGYEHNRGEPAVLLWDDAESAGVLTPS